MFGIIFLLLFLTFLFTFYLYLTRNFNHWKRKGVDFVPPTLGISNIGQLLILKKSIWKVVRDLHEQSQTPLLGFFLNNKPALIVRDLNLMKNIFITDFDHFVDRDISPNPKNEPFTANNLFGMKGHDWKNLRIKLSPAFTTGKIKNMFQLVNSSCKQLEDVLQEYSSSKKPFPVKDIMSRYTIDVIVSCAFGIDGKCLKDPDWILRRIMLKVTNPDAYTGFKFALLSIVPNFLKLFPAKILPDIVYKTLTDIIMDTVAYREKNNIRRNDFLDNLIELKKQCEENPNNTLEMNELKIVAQSFLFLIAGFDTGSTTMSLALLELAFNQEIQNKLRTEINDVLNKYNGEITYESVKEMSYLHQVLYETLRKYPTLPFLDRLCVKDYKIPDTNIVINKGTRVFISMMAIQRDPKYFENPFKFDPDRFSNDKIGSYNKFAFLPFGEGPRNCIGMRFGLMQVKSGIVQIIKNYIVEPSEFTPKEPKWSERNFALIIDDEFYLFLKKIKK